VIDREERALLVVPYTPGPPPRWHLVQALLCVLGAAVAVLMLFVADYSTTVAAALAATTGTLAVAALASAIVGIKARRRFRVEMERAVDVTPLTGTPARSEQAI
jgi:drug/metabolite transporter (DMT)-like permease